MKNQVQNLKAIVKILLIVTSIELEDFEIPTPRKAKSFQQRLAEKKTREKRLAMAKEARRWHMNQELSEMQVPTAWSPSTSTLRKKKMAPLPKISPLRLNSATALRQKPEAIQTTRRGVFLQYGSDRSEDPSLSSNRFKTPTKSKDADTMSVRSVMSTATRQRMLYALEWDSK